MTNAQIERLALSSVEVSRDSMTTVNNFKRLFLFLEFPKLYAFAKRLIEKHQCRSMSPIIPAQSLADE
ncbi:hypothetical protein [Nostoc sp. C117]|uniref:hypothetical protein n=1 Tax=Nostoc sp. C117 TaxID=3349875 RepID=UPI00370D9A3F